MLLSKIYEWKSNWFLPFRSGPANTEKAKKKTGEERKKLNKEKGRGRKPSDSESNSDQELSSRDESPSAPTKLTVNMWSRSTIGTNSVSRSASVEEASPDLSENKSSEAAADAVALSEQSDDKSAPTSICNFYPVTPTKSNDPCGSSTASSQCPTPSGGACKQLSKTPRNQEHAKRDRLDAPYFFPTTNQKMVRYYYKSIRAFLQALGHTVHCLGHGFKSSFPIGPFLSDMLILF